MIARIFVWGLLLTTPLAFSRDGHEVGNGDPIPFEMPKGDFSYTCDLLLRGRDAGFEEFYWAYKTIIFTKGDFAIIGGDNGVPASGAYVLYTSMDDGWRVNQSGSNLAVPLPNFLVGHTVSLQMRMGDSVEPPIPGVITNLIVTSQITQGETVSGYSDETRFRNRKNFAADFSYSNESTDKFIGFRAKCQRTE